MTPLPPTPEMLNVARRVIWFKKPEQALNDPVHFLSYAMRYGTLEDLITLENLGVGIPDYREVIDNAPSGVFDARSWHYWHLRIGREQVAPLPTRKIP